MRNRKRCTGPSSVWVRPASLESASVTTHFDAMRQISLSIAVAAALLIGGCATKPAGTSSGTTGTAPAEATTPRIAVPVTVPAASARKIVMAMTGSKQVVEAKDWADFKREWRETFADHAKAAGIEFVFVDGDVKPQAQDGTMLLVNVADYRMVGI